jgi:quinol-cytochrome oxidoreductase complex cytochrome b subunit
MIATAFVAVFLHMGKAFSFGVFYGARSSSWKSGFLLLLVMFGVSYAGCILPWTVLSPTLYTMVQTILDTYLGGWSVFILLGGEKLPMSILARTLIAHILLGVVGLILLGVHLRVVHFVGSSLNRFYTWVTLDRPLWLPNELVKETYLLFSYFFFFFFFTL